LILSSQSLAEGLEECSGYSARRKTVFVAEGVTMYFPERAVRAILREFSEVSGSSVIFSFMEEDKNGSHDFRGQQGLVAAWLRWRKEPFQWGITRGRLPEFLHDCGLEQHAVMDHHALRAEILAPLGLEDIPRARGECLCLCSPIE
jgi:O-methyltransferase involved in polyketide biosynthesis